MISANFVAGFFERIKTSLESGTSFLMKGTASTRYSIPFTMTVSANPGAAWPYEADLEFEVELTLAQAGWPLILGSVTTSSGVIIDLEDDGSREMIFGDHDIIRLYITMNYVFRMRFC